MSVYTDNDWLSKTNWPTFTYNKHPPHSWPELVFWAFLLHGIWMINHLQNLNLWTKCSALSKLVLGYQYWESRLSFLFFSFRAGFLEHSKQSKCELWKPFQNKSWQHYHQMSSRFVGTRSGAPSCRFNRAFNLSAFWKHQTNYFSFTLIIHQQNQEFKVVLN